LPTRTVPVTGEFQPEAFAEIAPELAKELGFWFFLYETNQKN
jgi:hypothetical protein